MGDDDKKRRRLRHCYIHKIYENDDKKGALVYFYSDDELPIISQSKWFPFEYFKNVKEFNKIYKSNKPSNYEFSGSCLINDEKNQIYDFEFHSFEPLVIDDELKELILKVFKT